MVQRLTGRKVLPVEVLNRLVATTDGVPLFVEELTKMILESGLVKEREGRYELAGPVPTFAIPATLHDSLMARLDRLGPSKQVAQLGAVLGREFSYEVIQAVAPVDEATLQEALAQLINAELVYQRGMPPQARYTFKHVLIQEAAYQSLPRSTRRHYHRQIVQVLETRFPETCKTHPELLAHHYTDAGLNARAVPYWQQAGQRAIQRSAHAEALSHFTQGLQLLRTLPDTPERTQHELALQLGLGGASRVIKGTAASDVEQAYDRALDLTQQLPDTAQRIRVLSSLAAMYDARGALQRAQALGEECLALALRNQDPESLRQAHQALGRTLYWRGQIVSARVHLEQAFTLSESQKDRSPPFFAARLHPREHSRMTNLCMTALILYLQGYPDQAWQRCHTALDLAQELSYPYSRVAVLLWATWLHLFCGEGQAAHERVETAVAMAIEQGFPLWEAMGTILHGWTLVAQGRGEDGIAQMHRGLTALRTMEVKQAMPSYLILLAEAYGKEGRTAEGLHVVEEALAEVDKTGARWEEAALYRLKGELLLACTAGHQGEAEACFQQALDVARRQQAKSIELRAAMSLARLWRRQAKPAQGRPLLAEVYGWFTEGFDTLDLREAKLLLEALQ
jgi:tetratricopeptide (TPR) repeat protein